MASEEELQDCFQVAKELAKRAGKVAYDALHKEKTIEIKESTADLVTETDKMVEELILSTLKERFPNHQFIGEETTSKETQGLTNDPTWMVDPIDGTSNFIHGFPFSAVSIGLAVNKTPVVGVVYNFTLDHLYAAMKGHGATMNGNSIAVSKCKEIGTAMICAELGSIRTDEILKVKIEDIHKIAKEPVPVVGMRMLGSAALDMCMVAQGSSDAYYEFGVHCWDIAAGDIILREAGGVTFYPTGEPLDVMRRGILCACTEELVKQLLPKIQSLEHLYKAD